MMEEKQLQQSKTISVANLISTNSSTGSNTVSENLTKNMEQKSEASTEHNLSGFLCSEIEKGKKNIFHDDREKSIAGSTFDMLKNSPTVNQAIGTGYRKLKKSVLKTGRKASSNNKPPKNNGFTQDIIPIKSIQNGIIQTTSGMFVKILEILPINFYDMSIDAQSDIANTFASIFNKGPARIHLKCITDKNNPARMISYIKQKCEEEKWQRGVSDGFIECAEDTIQKIKTISNENTFCKRYFLIYKYEGSSFESNDIFTDMETTKQSIITAFSLRMGNPVIDCGIERSSYEIGEILYYILNRKTCREELFSDRINRIIGDAQLYNSSEKIKKKKDPLDVDFISPKGLTISNNDYVMVDGQYVTYFSLKENGHPQTTYIGWMDAILSMCEGLELDIYINRKNHDTVMSALDQFTLVQSTSLNNPSVSSKKWQELFPKIENSKYIVRRMRNEENLFDVMIIITLRSDTIHGLRTAKQYLLKQLNANHLYVEDAYANIQKYYNMTLPLFEISADIFNRNKRNYLTSSLASLYMFTAFEFNDPTGAVLGQNAMGSNGSMVSINLFNTDYFPNANMSILGMSGSGKTYSTQILARAMRISGIRVFMILPLKGHEAYRGCKHIDGTFIHLYPGSNDCLNVCEIRPSMNIDKDVLAENIGVVQSLLSNQISFLITWINLNIMSDTHERPLTNEEFDIVESELYAMYDTFEITHDNDSIYDTDGQLKRMPVIGDIYDRLINYPELRRVSKAIEKYVTGNCKNMNGQTNVDLTGKYIVFYVDESNMPSSLLPAFLFSAIKCTYSLAQQSRLYKDMIFIDEAWKILMNELASEQIRDMVKIIRGYGGGVCITTQDINDLIDDPTGRAIISNTAVKLIMYLENKEAQKVASTLGLTDTDIRNITHFSKGQALLVTRQAKLYINIISSEMDDRDFTTDPNKLRKYAENENENKAQLK